MIFGRNVALWAGLLGTVLNAIAFLFALDPQAVILIDGAGLALLGVLANEADPSTVSTFAGTVTPPAK
jgi:hypothetical protein